MNDKEEFMVGSLIILRRIFITFYCTLNRLDMYCQEYSNSTFCFNLMHSMVVFATFSSIVFVVFLV